MMRLMPLLIMMRVHIVQGWWVTYIVAPSTDTPSFDACAMALCIMSMQ